MKRYLIGLITLLLIVGCGKKDGLHTEYYDDAKTSKKSEGNYKDGEKDGVWTYYRSGGKKDEEGAYRGVDSQGNPIKDGVWTYYNHIWDGKHAEHTYKEGQKNGKWTNWYENGQKRLELTYKDGKPDGLCTYWYENGQKQSEGTVKDGKKIKWDKDGIVWGIDFNEYHIGYPADKRNTFFVPKDGKWTHWLENGQKQSEGTYKHNFKDGKWTYWYENGQKKKEGNYSIGKDQMVVGSLTETETGFWTEWNENGQKKEERKRNENGELISWFCWDEDGNSLDCRKGALGFDINPIIDAVNLPELIEQAINNYTEYYNDIKY